MKEHVDKLQLIAQKNERMIIGLMSGTSLDGLDIAVCSIKGSGLSTEFELRKFKTVFYDNDLKNEIRSVFSKKMQILKKYAC